LPFDTLFHLWQRGDAMRETQNQFLLTRVASIIGGAAKTQLPIRVALGALSLALLVPCLVPAGEAKL